MQIFLNYLNDQPCAMRINKAVEHSDINTLIIMLLAVTPFYSDLMAHISALQGKALPWYGREERKKELTQLLLHELVYRGAEFKQLGDLIVSLPTNPLTIFKKLVTNEKGNPLVNRYLLLIRAYCLYRGTGIPRNASDALSLIEEIAETESQSDDGDLLFLKRIIQKWFTQSTLPVAKVLCNIEYQNVVNSKVQIYSFDQIEREFQPSLKFIREQMSGLSSAEKDELQPYYDDLYQSYVTTKIEMYQQLLSVNRQFQKELQSDKDMKGAWVVDPTDFFASYLDYCHKLYTTKGPVASVADYQLHSQLSRSPWSLMKLADLAANGLLAKNTAKPVSDFPRAASLYAEAMDEAIAETDIDALDAAVKNYQSLERSIPEANRFDVNAKIKKAIGRIAHEEKDQSIKWRIKAVTKRFKFKIVNLRSEATKELARLIQVRGLNSDLLEELKQRHLAVGGSPTEWLAILCIVTLPGADISQPTQGSFLQQAFREALPVIIRDLSNPEGVDVDKMLKLFFEIIEHRLYLVSSDLSTQFLNLASDFITSRLVQAILKSDLNVLNALKAFFEKKVQSPFINRLAEVSYWIERASLEQKYLASDEVPVNDANPLQDLYKLAISHRRGLKPTFALVQKSFIEQLKAIVHPEAYLKVAELTQQSLLPALPNEAFIHFGNQVIKAMTCAFTPGDSLGIYVTLAFKLICDAKTKRMDESFKEPQRDIIHFYYALALLIKDPATFDKEITGFFGKHCRLELAKSCLELLKNSKLLINDGVRRTLANRINGLGEILDPVTQKDVTKLIEDLKSGSTESSLLTSSIPAAAAPPVTSGGHEVATPFSSTVTTPTSSLATSLPPFNPAATAAILASPPEVAMVPIPVLRVAQASDAIDGSFVESSANMLALQQQLQAMQQLLAQKEAEFTAKLAASEAESAAKLAASDAEKYNLSSELKLALTELQKAKDTAATSEAKVATLQTELQETKDKVKVLRAGYAPFFEASRLIQNQTAVLSALVDESSANVSPQV